MPRRSTACLPRRAPIGKRSSSMTVRPTRRGGSRRGLCARDKRFRLLSDGRPAEGASAARNRGIAEATGRWLSFLDADDWLEPAFIEKMVGAAEAGRGLDVVYCSFRHVTMDGRQGPATLNTRVTLAPFETLARGCPLAIHTVVFRRSLMAELGGFDPLLTTNEDWDFWQRVARTGIAFHPVPGAVAFYRARRNSLSGNVRKPMADIQVRGRARLRSRSSRAAAGAAPRRRRQCRRGRDQGDGDCLLRPVGGGVRNRRGRWRRLVKPLPNRGTTLSKRAT